MSEIDRRQELGRVELVDAPHGISWLSFTNIFLEDYTATPVATAELEAVAQRKVEEGDFFMAGVNLLAESTADVQPHVLRIVSSLSDI